MSVSFDSRHNLIVVRARLSGPSGTVVLKLALDTGATSTLINAAPLVTIGYDPALSPDRVQVTTGSDVEFASRVMVERLESIGRRKDKFSVLCHTLPPSTGVDGLLGLNFLREGLLQVDFRAGTISLD
jgi:predicted aspartyl protease